MRENRLSSVSTSHGDKHDLKGVETGFCFLKIPSYFGGFSHLISNTTKEYLVTQCTGFIYICLSNTIKILEM